MLLLPALKKYMHQLYARLFLKCFVFSSPIPCKRKKLNELSNAVVPVTAGGSLVTLLSFSQILIGQSLELL